jgi:hypothetical protein
MSEGRSIGKSRASATGAWEIVISTAMPPGTHILSLAATDGAGNEVRSSDVAVVFVPQPPEEGPDLKTAKGEKKPAADDGVLAVMLPREGGMAGCCSGRDSSSPLFPLVSSWRNSTLPDGPFSGAGQQSATP